jgi:hypothetical protein
LKKNSDIGARLSKWLREKLMRRARERAAARKTDTAPRA